MSNQKEVRKIVIDASIAVKWANPSEEHGDIAAIMLDDYEQERLSFVIPEFFFYEVASGISKAVLRKEITPNEAEEALDDFLSMKLEVHPLSKVKAVYFLSQTYKRSIYDCLYIDLAQRLGLEFWTADEKLYNATKDKLPFVKWIGDYKEVVKNS